MGHGPSRRGLEILSSPLFVWFRVGSWIVWLWFQAFDPRTHTNSHEQALINTRSDASPPYFLLSVMYCCSFFLSG